MRGAIFNQPHSVEVRDLPDSLVIGDVLFGQFRRREPSQKERSLVTAASLTTSGNTEQLFHLGRAKERRDRRGTHRSDHSPGLLRRMAEGHVRRDRRQADLRGEHDLKGTFSCQEQSSTPRAMSAWNSGTTQHRRADRRSGPIVRNLHLRLRHVALPRDRSLRRTSADGSRVCRHRRGGRQRGHDDQTRHMGDTPTKAGSSDCLGDLVPDPRSEE
jgi:hypothetical protein